ncbi:U-box domain-containing protein 33-like isoform X2 [Typha latifolia]|uniref:U-box domain-containing protein 33-like isoform X2 n=1 Tax=Typha latifolia TaxID=4733 RepID=UPI003C2EEFBD
MALKEEEEEKVVMKEEKVYVAVGNDVKEWKANLLWVFHNIPRYKKIVILHIHRSSKTIPIVEGCCPADQVNEQKISAYRTIETQKMNQIISHYMMICMRAKVRAEKLVIEMDDIDRGIVMLVAQHGIAELVMGAAADEHCTNEMKIPFSKTALSVQQQADPSCKIWFVSKGNLIYTREACLSGSSTERSQKARPSYTTSQSERSSSRSLPDGQVKSIDLMYGSTQEVVKHETVQCNSEGGTIREASPHEKDVAADNVRHNNSRRGKEIDTPYTKEMIQKKTEERLTRETMEIELLIRQRHEILEKLQKARQKRAGLELQVTKSTHIVKDLQDKLSMAHRLLLTLEQEQEELQQERDNAAKEAEQLHQRVQELENINLVTESFSEFSHSEIEEATNNFDESLKIGEGGYGSVYKGFLRHTVVAIKMFNPQGMQGKAEFYRELDVLSRLRHPNLVNLIGACPETWALVYEFLPNGSLEDRLNRKDDTPPLDWQARMRIAAEVCSALIFLHSNNHLTLMHGDLKPSNILLDANFISKLGDFSIYRLLQSNAKTVLFCSTSSMDTFVYMDPEFLASGELTPSSDVYSFGVILLRLLTGKPALGSINEVHDAVEEGRLSEILDSSAGEWPYGQAMQLAELGLKCCEIRRKSRPVLDEEAWKVLEPMMKAAYVRDPPDGYMYDI